MEVGVAKGLAQSFQYDQRISDERFYANQMQRAQAENQAGLKAFEDDLDYMNAANSFDHDLIAKEADKTTREIGEIMRNNPDWKVNPDVRRMINQKKKYIKSNNHVIRGMASDDAFKNLNKDLAEVAKNPNMHDTEAYQNLIQQRNNYLKYGHQEGEEGLKRDGAPQLFTYTKPQDFVDINDEAIKVGNKYHSDKYSQDGNGGYHQLVDENTLRPLAMNLYNSRKRQFQVQNGVKSDEEGIQAAANMIKAGIKLERKFGEPNHALIAAQWKHRMEQEGGGKGGGQKLDAYNKMIRDAGSSYPGAETLTKMIGVKPVVKIYDVDNNYVKDDSGREFIPVGSYMQVPTMVRSKDGFKKSTKGNDNLGVIHGYSVYSKKEMDELGWYDEPSMKKKIEERYDSGKDKEPRYYVKSQHVFNPMNQAYAFKLNHEVGETSKQIDGMNPVENVPRREVEYDTDGNMWDAETKEYLGKQK